MVHTSSLANVQLKWNLPVHRYIDNNNVDIHNCGKECPKIDT